MSDSTKLLFLIFFLLGGGGYLLIPIVWPIVTAAKAVIRPIYRFVKK